MKKIFFLFAILFFSININAQHPPKEGKEKIQALKIAYLTEKLDLTVNEAEKFWPIFNKYHKKRTSLFNFEQQELKQTNEGDYDVNTLTNSEAEKTLKKVFEYREERYQNKISFHKELLKVLPPKKILILEIKEKEFNRDLMRKFREKRERRENK